MDDLISRQAVKDIFFQHTPTDEIITIFEKIITLPTVQPKTDISVLEDIKAEIEKEYLAEGHLTEYWDGIDKCLQIINKHISGKENES